MLGPQLGRLPYYSGAWIVIEECAGCAVPGGADPHAAAPGRAHPVGLGPLGLRPGCRAWRWEGRLPP